MTSWKQAGSSPVFSVKWLDGLRINLQYVRSRGQLWIVDQKYKVKVWKQRPRGKKNIVWRYPFRSPLPPDLRQLYKQTALAVKHALGTWHNPWIWVPPCAFALGLENPAAYNTYRHEVQLGHVFEYWHRQIQVFLPKMRAAIHLARRGEFQAVPWEILSGNMMERAAIYREYFEEVDTQGLFPGLSEAWLLFEQQLLPLLEECQNRHSLPEALVSWHTSLEQFNQILRDCLRVVFIHELIHAWMRWGSYREGKHTYRLIGVIDYRPDTSTPTSQNKSPLVHDAMNEALTEWMAQRLYEQIYGRVWRFSWNGVTFHSCYPAWIIECLVEALDHEWSRIAQSLPLLVQHQVHNASELLYTLAFSTRQAVSWLKEALVALSGDPDAFEKVSRACEHFMFRLPHWEALVKESWDDLLQLFAPFLPEGISIPRIFGLYTEELSDGELSAWLLQSRERDNEEARRVNTSAPGTEGC